VRFQARLSSALPWTVTVADATGAVVAQGKGRGTLVDWTWRAAVSPKGSYRWTIDAGQAVRPATGTFGVARAASPLLSALSVAPAVVAPAPDGAATAATVAFTLGVSARVTIQLLDGAGKPVLKLLDEQRSAGANTFAWSADALPDGRYTVAVTARVQGTAPVTLKAGAIVERTLTGLTAAPTTSSPNGDGIADVTTVAFVLTRDVPVRFAILRNGLIAATPFEGQLTAGPHVLVWDGSSSTGRVPDGPYVAASR
jgi:hypothetical protein